MVLAKAIERVALEWYAVVQGEVAELSALKATQSLIGSNTANLISVQRGRTVQTGAVSTIDRSWEVPYFHHFARMNPIMPLAEPKLRRGAVVAASEVIDARVLKSTEFFNDYMRMIGSEHEVGIACEKHPTWEYVLQFGRSLKDGDFSVREKEALRLVGVHVQRAMGTRRARQQHNALTGHLVHERTSQGIILMTSSGRVLRARGDLIELMQASGFLKLVRGHVDFGSQELQAKYKRILSATSTPYSFAESFPSLWQGHAVDLSLIPIDKIARQVFSIDADLLLLIRSEKLKEELSFQFKSDQLKLTKREREVLKALTQGESIASTADVMEISQETVRTHVKALLRKTGCNSQVQLMAYFSPNRHWSESPY